MKDCAEETGEIDYALKWRTFSKTRQAPHGADRFDNDYHIDLAQSVDEKSGGGGGISSSILTDDPGELEASIMEDLMKNVVALQSLYTNRPAPSVALEVSDVSSLIQT
jgi:hypothetical protein